MSSIVLLPSSLLQLPAPMFEAWEREFVLRPCEVMYEEAFVCGHDAHFKARATCPGCGESRFPAFLCSDHLRAYDHHRMVYHLDPCGAKDYYVRLQNIERIVL